MDQCMTKASEVEAHEENKVKILTNVIFKLQKQVQVYKKGKFNTVITP